MTVSFDEEAMWSRLETFPLAGRQVAQLRPADLLLLLCFTAPRTAGNASIASATSPSSYGRIRRWTGAKRSIARKRSGVERMVLVGLSLAKDLLDAPLTPDLEFAVQRDPVARTMVPRLRHDLATPIELLDLQGQLRPTLLHLQLRERWSDRIRYCAARLSPTVGDWVALPLPQSLSFLYYVLRPVRLAMRKIK